MANQVINECSSNSNEDHTLLSAMANMHAQVVIDGKRITMTYRILPGEEQRSFGIHCAIQQGFPDHVTTIAQQKADQLEKHGRQVKFDLDLQEMQQSEQATRSEQQTNTIDSEFKVLPQSAYNHLNDSIVVEAADLLLNKTMTDYATKLQVLRKRHALLMHQ
jgi:DNA mismatch repair ATPase MutS